MKHNVPKVRMPGRKNPAAVIIFFMFLLFAYVITTAGLMVLAFLLYKFSLDESAVNIGVIVIYVLSAFVSSFVCGKKCKTRKFVWGLAIGSAYFAVLFLLSLVMESSAVNPGGNAVTSFLICTGSGMLGGMLA